MFSVLSVNQSMDRGFPNSEGRGPCSSTPWDGDHHALSLEEEYEEIRGQWSVMKDVLCFFVHSVFLQSFWIR